MLENTQFKIYLAVKEGFTKITRLVLNQVSFNLTYCYERLINQIKKTSLNT